MPAVFCAPWRYTQGPDATQLLGREIKGLGIAGPALVVSSPSPRKQLEPMWTTSLGEASISFRVHDFAGESTDAEVARIAATARETRSHVVIGAGGGKVLDAARAAACDLDLPFVSCPTVASTDAPCSAVSVIYDDAGVFLRARILPRNPELVLVDTRVIMQAPVRTLVAGMGDALSTMFEAKACVRAGKPNFRGGSCTRTALAMAELCHQTLMTDGVQALADAKAGRLTPALEHVIEANTLLSGLGFESAGLAAAHGVHNGLTAAPGTHDFMHGEKVAFGVLAQLMLEPTDDATIAQVLRFCTAVGLPVTLAQIGCSDLPKEMLAKVAARATAPGEVTHNMPFPVTPGMVEKAILAADARGREFLERR